MICMRRSEQHGSALESLLCSRKASFHTVWYMLWWEHAEAGWGILSWGDPGSPPPTGLTTTWHQFLYQLTAYCLLWLEGSSIFALTLSVSFPAIPTPDIGTLPSIQRMSIKCVSWMNEWASEDRKALEWYGQVDQVQVFQVSLGVMGFPCGSDGKESTCSARDAGALSSIPGSGKSPGEENGNPLQYPCLENSMSRGAWQATVHRVAKSRTQLRN